MLCDTGKFTVINLVQCDKDVVQCVIVLCSVVQWSSVWYSTVYCITVQDSFVQTMAVWNISGQCCTVHCYEVH